MSGHGDLTFRGLNGGDAEAAAVLHAGVLADSWPTGSWEVLLADPLGIGEGALDETGLQGLILLRVVAEECEIIMLLVAMTHRRRGLAASLLERGLRKAAARGAGHTFLEVAADNQPAISLYHRFGFAEIGRRTGYYATSGGPRDALVLSRPLALDAPGCAS